MNGLPSKFASLRGVAGSNPWKARCPAHDDDKASLSLSHDAGKWLVKCHAGCETKDVVAALGLSMADLYDEPRGSGRAASGSRESGHRSRCAAIYRDAAGQPYLGVLRTPDKVFIQAHRAEGGWFCGKPKGEKIPYRLPELLASDGPVFVCEGEKDADNLAAKLGRTATTASEGAAAKWTPDLSKHFRGRTVYILPDNDDAGRKHALDVARNLVGVAKEVRIVKLPGLAEKGDVSDWLDGGGTAAVLDILCREAPVFAEAELSGAEISEANISKAEADRRVNEINRDYALVLAGDKAAVMKFDSPTRFRLLQVSAFSEWFANKVVRVGKKPVPLGNYWRKHPDRRQYEGIEFEPGGGREGYYNLWQGLAVEAIEGDCSRFLAHIKDNVAQGNEEYNKWIIGWMAQIVQHPTEKLGTSLVLRGAQGVGKTIVGQYFGSLFHEDHYSLVADPRYVVGQFNSHMAALLVLHADEAFFAGDKRMEGKIKDLVTGHYHFVEFKGKDPIRIRNYIRLLVTGNSDWLVSAGFDERRPAIFDVGTKHIQDIRYFKAISDEASSGGREALLYHLLHFDLTRVDLRVIPKTEALFDQKRESFDAKQAWWYDMLDNGELPGGPEPGACEAKALFARYAASAKLRGDRHRASQTALGIFLRKIAPGTDSMLSTYSVLRKTGSAVETVTKRGRCYWFPPLKKCRETFDQKIGHHTDWSEPDKEWQQEGPVWEEQDEMPLPF